MPSQQEVTTFTLSFAGVNFTLEPNTADQADNMLSIAKVAGDEILIDFTSFSGLMRVTKVNTVDIQRCANNEAQTTVLPKEDSEVMEVYNDDDHALNKERVVVAPPPILPDAVPEEMPSPEPKVEKEKVKGQQKLDFFSKRVSKLCIISLCTRCDL
jgi:hypothetical protein